MQVDHYSSSLNIIYRDNSYDKLAGRIIEFFWANKNIEGYEFELIKADKSEVYKLHTPNAVYYVKYYQAQKFSKKIKNLVRKPAAARHFYTANKLLASRIGTAEPILGIVKDKNLLLKESLFVTREIQGINLYEHAKSQPEIDTRRIIIKKLAKLWAKLINNNFWHKDPRLFNIMLQEDGQSLELILVDIDNIYSLPIFPHRLVIKNLTKLSADMLKDVITSDTKSLTPQERILFFAEFTNYYERDVNLKQFINRVNDRVIKRLRKKNYRKVIDKDPHFSDYFGN